MVDIVGRTGNEIFHMYTKKNSTWYIAIGTFPEIVSTFDLNLC